MKAVILAGGKGTRLGERTTHIPKPMIPLNGKPLLQYQVEWCAAQGFSEIILIVNHLSEPIKQHFGDGSAWNIPINYYQEAEPLGTTGGIKAIENQLRDDFLVLYGDVLFDIDWQRLWQFHREKQSEGTLVVHPNDHPYDSDLIEIDEEERVVAVHPKPHPEGLVYHNLVNAALYLFSPAILDHLPKGKKADFGKDIFPAVYPHLRLYAYNTSEYLKDMGTPDRLARVEADLQSGFVEARALRNPQKAIFLDRDGVINYDTDLIDNPDDFELYPGTEEAIAKINRSGRLAIVATNQSVVARNRTTIQGLGEIHKKMETRLGGAGAKLDAIYYCPHHPDKGYPGENPLYKIECHCRKPKPGMLTDAAERFNIDLKASYMIGDSERDVLAGQNAGCTTIGVRTGHGQRKSKVNPDFFMANLAEAVQFILDDPYRQARETLLREAARRESQPLIVSLAGQSRSGKSTLARVLEKHWQMTGKEVLYVRLDDWILPRDKRRRGEGVLDNFQIDKLSREVQRILEGETIHIHPYAALPGRQQPPRSYQWKGEDIVLLEGVVALSNDRLRALAQLKAYLEIDENQRRERFIEYYRWRGYEERTIESLYQRRLREEYPIIEESKKYADLRLSAGS